MRANQLVNTSSPSSTRRRFLTCCQRSWSVLVIIALLSSRNGSSERLRRENNQPCPTWEERNKQRDWRRALECKADADRSSRRSAAGRSGRPAATAWRRRQVECQGGGPPRDSPVSQGSLRRHVHAPLHRFNSDGRCCGSRQCARPSVCCLRIPRDPQGLVAGFYLPSTRLRRNRTLLASTRTLPHPFFDEFAARPVCENLRRPKGN